MKSLLQKTLTALMITSLVATSGMAAAQIRLESLDSLERNVTTMMPAFLVFEDKKAKPSALLQESLIEDVQK
ncbi:MAG TPA: hypothetical protein DD412_00390 [Holosporales bacterium]|nr:hypothetical protein [Holosporales bacterium]